MRDVMLDFETTGTDPHVNGILQIGAVRFDFDTGEVDPNLFDMAAIPAPGRAWDLSTIMWWKEDAGRAAHLNKLMNTGVDARCAFEQFAAWVGRDGARLWAKPTTFEFPFLQSHCRQLGVPNPFHFRFARDVNSFLAGMARDPGDPRTLATELPFTGQQHNALHDALHDLKVLLHAKAAG